MWPVGTSRILEDVAAHDALPDLAARLDDVDTSGGR
jgi:hypothetical protein